MRRTHIFIIDGTLSRLDEGEESNAGLLYKLLCRQLPHDDLTVDYDPGVQGEGLRKWMNVVTGNGINQSIMAGYRRLCECYREGDQIALFGYSRGAYAVRSIAGMIAMVGLLRHDVATERMVAKAFSYYQKNALTRRGKIFVRHYTHRRPVRIEMIGVWDTVKSLGVPVPLLSRFAPMATEFHDHNLSPIISNAFQALAADENRRAFAEIPWTCRPNWQGRLEQVWFPGAHSDVGGYIFELPGARPLANLSLVWMLERASECGVPLPDGWQQEFPVEPLAPMQGPYAGSSKYFLFRRPRHFGALSTDQVHKSIHERETNLPNYHTRLTGYKSG